MQWSRAVLPRSLRTLQFRLYMLVLLFESTLGEQQANPFRVLPAKFRILHAGCKLLVGFGNGLLGATHIAPAVHSWPKLGSQSKNRFVI